MQRRLRPAHRLARHSLGLTRRIPGRNFGFAGCMPCRGVGLAGCIPCCNVRRPRARRGFDLGAMRHLFGLAVERLEVEKKMQYVNLIVENINRLKQAIGNLLGAVENPILMPYIGGEEVLDLEPGDEPAGA